MNGINFKGVLRGPGEQMINIEPNQAESQMMQVPPVEMMQRQNMPPEMMQSQGMPPAETMSRQPPTQGQDPFAMSPFNNVRLPDAPISFGGGMAEQMLNDNEVPEVIREKYWYVFHKDNILTFLDEKRKENKLLNFDITKIDVLNSMPYYDYNFERELEFGVLRNVFETKLDRALGATGQNIKNERVMLQSSFTEQRNINEQDGGMIKEGFFKRLLGRR